MKKINHEISKNLRVFTFIVMTLLIGLQSHLVLANQAFSFSPYIDLSSQGLINKSWLDPIANPTQENELFLIESAGKIYRASGQKVEPIPMFDFAAHLKEHTPERFTAVTLHPNFHMLDQQGSQTLYTAHIELFNAQSTNDRLSGADSNINYTHDAVVLEWKIDDSKVNDIKFSQVREVMRIGTTSADINIKQLAFNSLLKSWDNNFGLLFVAINYDETLAEEPLYSGAVLRINPQKFGTINYSIPQNNPFISQQDINDEIVILGAQNVSKIVWTKYTKSNILLTHEYNNQASISLTALGNNFLATPPINTIYNTTAQASDLASQYYNGRKLSRLRNKFVVLNHNEKNWQLESVSVNQPLKTKTELVLSTNDFIPSSKLSLYIPRENEVLMWDQTKAIIYKLVANITTSSAPIDLVSDNASEKELTSSDMFFRVLLGIGILIISLLLFLIAKKYQNSKTKILLRSNYARFRFDTESNKISLFKRHQTAVDRVISIDDIISSEVFLNGKFIGEVNSQENKHCSNDLDKEMRRLFEEEHRHKMLDRKIRKIDVKIITQKNEEVLVCAYLREGNQRLTRETFHTVIEYVLDWQWHLSYHLYKDGTPERAPKPLQKKSKSRIIKKKVTQPVTVEQPITVNQPTATPNTKKQVSVTTKPEIKPLVENDKHHLINSLDKLIEYKEKGLLTDDEFIAAKNRVLSDTSNAS